MDDSTVIPDGVIEDITLLKITGAAQPVLAAYLRGVRRSFGIPEDWVLDIDLRVLRPPAERPGQG